ncbi:helix-turn-helix domain-containing protein [Clostridium sp. Marseille-P3244]|uniref:helix-turn-helix domain-containing protein n=1 Tax=Clostridium sp. Marseille-P3244 TaxID=1871020 RepID=UPI0009F9C6CC|nr:helix-turn-helix transcriptional regulator [Clostridium sp. Marseille-P3244]
MNTAQRIKEALELRNMKQADLVEKTQISKGALSSYISGAYEPKQKNLYKIAKALNVSESWLMGLDVPMERENKWANIKKSINKTDAFEAQLKAIGWTCEYFGCNDWELIENGGMGLNDEGEMVDGGTGHPIGCSLPNKGYTKCENCVYRHPHYKFSNGTLSFDVSIKEYNSFCNDVELFYKKRLQKLLLKSSEQIFDNDTELNAAHARTDIDIPEGIDTSDDDIMDDENF